MANSIMARRIQTDRFKSMLHVPLTKF